MIVRIVDCFAQECCRTMLAKLERPKHDDWIYVRVWCRVCGSACTRWRTIQEYWNYVKG